MLLLNRREVSELLSLDHCIGVVEQAFKAYAERDALGTGMLHLAAPDGEFHVKAGSIRFNRLYFALKVNGSFFRNSERFGMPNIQGAIYLADAETGLPLALMDSIEITLKRTAAATAVAAKYLANPESSTVTICGCGNQGRVQLRALKSVLPLKRAYAFGRSEAKVHSFASEMSEELKIEVRSAVDSDNLSEALRQSSVVVTCTPSTQPFIRQGDILPGSFIAAVGADSPHKQELEMSLLSSSKVVVDILDQCVRVGELHHAIAGGLMKREDVHAELGEIVAGIKTGRITQDEITIFDSTGTALQDAAAAAAIYEKATKQGQGTKFSLLS